MISRRRLWAIQRSSGSPDCASGREASLLPRQRDHVGWFAPLAILLSLLAGCHDSADTVAGDGHDAAGDSAGSSGSGGGGSSGADSGGAGTGGAAGGDGGCKYVDPTGTWRITYGKGCETAGDDVVFIRHDSESTLAVEFADRQPSPSTCASGGRPSYSTSVPTSLPLCELRLALETSWCMSGEGQCDNRRISLSVTDQSGVGTLEWTRCWNPNPGGTPVTCTATATRLAGPVDCRSVTGHDTCVGAVTCNSGCGTPCTCESGVWNCTYPERGSLCRIGEGCIYKQSDLGGFDNLTCVSPEGEPFFDGSLHQGGTECPASGPASGSSCATFPAGLTCPYATGSFTCSSSDAGAKSWTPSS